jgi:hypothetical protein
MPELGIEIQLFSDSTTESEGWRVTGRVKRRTGGAIDRFHTHTLVESLW